MFSYLELMRPANAFMALLAVIIGGLLVLSTGVFSSLSLYFALIAVFVITGAGNVINDYFDVKADTINKPSRPIPSGRVSKNSALIFALLLFGIGIVLSYFLHPLAFSIAIVNSLLTIVYAWKCKQQFLVGNVVVAYLVGSTFLYGAAAMGLGVSSLSSAFVLFLLAFLVNMSREIAKDLEDIKGDKLAVLHQMKKEVKKKLATLSGRFKETDKGIELKHKRPLLVLGTLTTLCAIIISPFPFLWGIFGLSYLLVVLLADAVFFVTVVLFIISKRKADYTRIAKLLKIGMFLGLISFVIGVLI